jgi:hypothetical protein
MPTITSTTYQSLSLEENARYREVWEYQKNKELRDSWKEAHSKDTELYSFNEWSRLMNLYGYSTRRRFLLKKGNNEKI